MTLGIDVPWTKMINPQLTDVNNGYLVLSQTPEEIHLNHNGDMHAGVIFSMLEMAGMGVVVMLLGELANQALVVVKKMDIDFIARAQGSIRFEASIEPEMQKRILQNAKQGKKIEESVKVQAFNSAGECVAKAELVAVIAPKM